MELEIVCKVHNHWFGFLLWYDHLLCIGLSSWFTCFIYVIVCFIFFSGYFVKIIPPELSVLLLIIFFSPSFIANFWLHVTYTALFVFIRGGHNMAAMELSFGHNTTKTWQYSFVFGSFRIFLSRNMSPHPNHFLKIQWEIHFFTQFLGTKSSKQKFRTVLI